VHTYFKFYLWDGASLHMPRACSQEGLHKGSYAQATTK